MEAAQTYQALADGEQNPRRRELLAEMAGMEREHARVWEQRLREAGLEPPSPPSGLRAWFYGKLARHAGPAATLERIEKDEEKHSGLFRSQMRQMDSADAALLEQIAHDEDVLARRLHMANAATREQGELDYIFGKEKWHVRSGSWVADAVYGANDGLGAVFGIVSGMAGYTGGSSLVLVAGLAGTVAGALSMGSSAYLAAKSEKEVIEAELERERLEIAENPEEERRELELFYRLKGFSDEETAILVNRVSRSDEHLLQALAHEELGISHASAPNPLTSMVSATLSTTAGGAYPADPVLLHDGDDGGGNRAGDQPAGAFRGGSAEEPADDAELVRERDGDDRGGGGRLRADVRPGQAAGDDGAARSRMTKERPLRKSGRCTNGM